MPKDNKKNKRYSKEQVDKMVSKMLAPKSTSITKLSNETGIPKSTLSGWKKRALKKKTLKSKKIGKNTSEYKFHIVMETYTLSEYDLGKYCREKGLYIDEVKKWRQEIESSLDKEPSIVKEVKEKLSEEKKKSKSLEKELKRKEKALAEAAALLVLKKKFQAFMEEKED